MFEVEKQEKKSFWKYLKSSLNLFALIYFGIVFILLIDFIFFEIFVYDGTFIILVGIFYFTFLLSLFYLRYLMKQKKDFWLWTFLKWGITLIIAFASLFLLHSIYLGYYGVIEIDDPIFITPQKNDPYFHNNKGWEYWKLWEYDKAVESYNRARAYEKLGEYEKAKKDRERKEEIINQIHLKNIEIEKRKIIYPISNTPKD